MNSYTQFQLFIVFCIVLFLPYIVFSQGIKITTGGNIKVSGAAIINIVDGNFVNNGTYNNGTETVTMSGTSAKTMSGNGNTSMYHLNVTNSGGITTQLPLLTTTTLNIATGSKLTIDTTRAVSVSTIVSNNAGTSGLIIKSNPLAANGSLIYHNAYNSPVQATVEMYSKASIVSGNYKWQYFGIPIRTMTAFPTFNGGYLRQFNEAGTGSGTTPDKHWYQLQNSSVLNAFNGYEACQTSPKTFYFAGDLVNSNYYSGKLAFTYTSPTVHSQYPGQHLIGNPYTAAIDISKIEFGSSDTLVMQNTVYLFNTGSYADWQAAGSGTASSSSEASYVPGQYLCVPKSTAGMNGLPSQIPSMQAFLIMVKSDNASATISIPYSSVGTVVKNTTKQRADAVPKVSTRINVQGTGYGDNVWLITEPSCSRAYDNGWDGYKTIYIGVAQLYAMETSGNYQVNSVGNINDTYLGFQAGTVGNYTLTFNHENMESQYPALYLIDLMNNNKVTDITINGSKYNFEASNTSTVQKRFKIVTSLDGVTQNKVVNKTVFSINNMGNTIFVNNFTNHKGFITLYDIAGKAIQKSPFTENNVSTINTNLSNGIYLIKAVIGDSQLAFKIVIE
jgi:hypothetical protein